MNANQMELKILKPRKALNKAFLKVKPNRTEIEIFKTNLIQLLDRIKDTESEEFHKNLVSDFLKKTWYEPKHFVNTKGRNDLVIHTGDKSADAVGVIIEAKKPGNKSEMITAHKLNVKAFQELVLYYLRERITLRNLEIKYLIATNINEWFIFEAVIFDRLFAQDKLFVRQFVDFEEGRLADTKTDFFYKQIAEPFISEIKTEIECTHFDIREYDKPLRNKDKKDDNLLISLFKLLSPEHLLKLPFANDSNTLDKRFFVELLHIMGLSETKEGSRKLIGRNIPAERLSGSLMENAIIQLDSLDKISRLENPEQFGKDLPEMQFNVGLELSITWINRILFLKLLEAQLLSYHKGDKSYEFLNLSKIRDYDNLNNLFFQVLARRPDERHEDIKAHFAKVPYLNSSLFEPTELEHNSFFISQLRNDKTIPVYSATVLKDNTGKKRSGEINPLEYLFAFLNAYDFASEGSEEIQEDNKTLINASVLGLIFEKLNGYKDGSFFTLGFITMYMCRETIRKAVIHKFNDVKGWNCTDFISLYNKIEDREEANKIINNLKICDPAVGSGHFLVSALNELITIKSDLKILLDRTGRRLKEYHLEVVNDELIITVEDGALFEYAPTNKESQRVQEALFHEKQTIIENCLFGVDINPNSVKICRLRLWIELLKNAYYKQDQEPTGFLNQSVLETLPNIDINIKCGNSLISRFPLDADLKQIARSAKWNIFSYQNAVKSYKTSTDKESKRELEKLINSIKSNYVQTIQQKNPSLQQYYRLKQEYDYKFPENGLFAHDPEAGYGPDGKKREEEKRKLVNQIEKLQAEIEAEKTFFETHRAFEWRFEFPEVLKDNGDFVGFDVVIGNPPYIRQEEFAAIKDQLKVRFKVFNSTADQLTYFIELGHHLLMEGGLFQFIVSNKFTRANYGRMVRNYLLENTKITHFIDFSGIAVFDEATVDAAILGFEKKIAVDNQLVYAKIKKEDLDLVHFGTSLLKIQKSFSQKNLTTDIWAFENAQVLAIKQKVESQGIQLKDWNITINYGIKTGYNEAFVIDGQIRDQLIASDKKYNEILKPILRGQDIKAWKPNFAKLWVIFIPKGFTIKMNMAQSDANFLAEAMPRYGNMDTQSAWNWLTMNYPDVANYLLPFKSKAKLRQDQGDFWWEQRACAYLDDFAKPKIIYPNMTKFLPFVIDLEGLYYHNDKSFHIVADRIYWLGAFLNSRLFSYCFRDNFPELLGGTRELRKVFFDKIPVKQLTAEEEKPFEELVTQILNLKHHNYLADTHSFEKQIDQMVYKLYHLTDEEIAIVEKADLQ